MQQQQNYESHFIHKPPVILQQRYMYIEGMSDVIACHATFHILPNMKKEQNKPNAIFYQIRINHKKEKG